MPAPRDYFLSDDENAAIFEQQIRQAEFGRFGDGAVSLDTNDTAKKDRPVCIILAGQTGAGKSHTAPALAAALNKAYGGGVGGGGDVPASTPRYCHLVADTHKPYHPAYAGLVADAAAGKVPPGLASAATGHDARRWLAKACAVAAAGGGGGGGGDPEAKEAAAAGRPPRRPPLPTLVESASRYPEDVAEMAGIFRRAGYRVCIVLLAVHATQSRLGLLARYLDALAAPPQPEKEKENPQIKKLPIRLTPRPIHDESYAGLAELARALDKEQGEGEGCPADAVLILRRDCRVAYANYYYGGDRRWETSPPGVARALEAERARCISTAIGSSTHWESSMFYSDVARLLSKHPERAPELKALAAEFEAAMAPDGDEAKAQAGTAAALGELSPLDADALVARLRSEW